LKLLGDLSLEYTLVEAKVNIRSSGWGVIEDEVQDQLGKIPYLLSPWAIKKMMGRHFLTT